MFLKNKVKKIYQGYNNWNKIKITRALPGPKKYGLAMEHTLDVLCKYKGIPLLCVTCTQPSGNTSKWFLPFSNKIRQIFT